MVAWGQSVSTASVLHLDPNVQFIEPTRRLAGEDCDAFLGRSRPGISGAGFAVGDHGCYYLRLGADTPEGAVRGLELVMTSAGYDLLDEVLEPSHGAAFTQVWRHASKGDTLWFDFYPQRRYLLLVAVAASERE